MTYVHHRVKWNPSDGATFAGWPAIRFATTLNRHKMPNVFVIKSVLFPSLQVQLTDSILLEARYTSMQDKKIKLPNTWKCTRVYDSRRFCFWSWWSFVTLVWWWSSFVGTIAGSNTDMISVSLPTSLSSILVVILVAALLYQRSKRQHKQLLRQAYQSKHRLTQQIPRESSLAYKHY